jgi:hypothetical protein
MTKPKAPTTNPLRDRITEALTGQPGGMEGPTSYDVATKTGDVRQDVRRELDAMSREGLVIRTGVAGVWHWELAPTP